MLETITILNDNYVVWLIEINTMMIKFYEQLFSTGKASTVGQVIMPRYEMMSRNSLEYVILNAA